MRRTHPDLALFVDPVLGDYDHGIYVDPRMANAYWAHLLGFAAGATPNGFELSCLTDLPTDTLEEVIQAARVLLGRGPDWVVVTSAAPDTWPPGEMLVVVVTRDSADVVRHARLDCRAKGTGDLFSASLTARLLKGASLVEAVGRACAEVLCALELTAASGSAELLLPDSNHHQSG
ncbi:Pyridoxine kinase [compost metagenome]